MEDGGGEDDVAAPSGAVQTVAIEIGYIIQSKVVTMCLQMGMGRKVVRVDGEGRRKLWR